MRGSRHHQATTSRTRSQRSPPSRTPFIPFLLVLTSPHTQAWFTNAARYTGFNRDPPPASPRPASCSFHNAPRRSTEKQTIRGGQSTSGALKAARQKQTNTEIFKLSQPRNPTATGRHPRERARSAHTATFHCVTAGVLSHHSPGKPTNRSKTEPLKRNTPNKGRDQRRARCAARANAK